jgi:hypothetical protein
MIEETWLLSRCLAIDGRSDSDIPAFSGTPQYFNVLSYELHIVVVLYILNYLNLL